MTSFIYCGDWEHHWRFASCFSVDQSARWIDFCSQIKKM